MWLWPRIWPYIKSLRYDTNRNIITLQLSHGLNSLKIQYIKTHQDQSTRYQLNQLLDWHHYLGWVCFASTSLWSSSKWWSNLNRPWLKETWFLFFILFLRSFSKPRGRLSFNGEVSEEKFRSSIPDTKAKEKRRPEGQQAMIFLFVERVFVLLFRPFLWLFPSRKMKGNKRGLRECGIVWASHFTPNAIGESQTIWYAGMRFKGLRLWWANILAIKRQSFAGNRCGMSAVEILRNLLHFRTTRLI